MGGQLGSARCRPSKSVSNNSNKPLVVFFSRIVPCLAGDDEARGTCHSVSELRFSPFVQFNEFQERLLNPLDGIAVAAPNPASVEWNLVC